MAQAPQGRYPGQPSHRALIQLSLAQLNIIHSAAKLGQDCAQKTFVLGQIGQQELQLRWLCRFLLPTLYFRSPVPQPCSERKLPFRLPQSTIEDVEVTLL